MERKNIFHAQSESGIRIVGEKIPGVQSASIGIWVKAGPVFERENERGISHFIEHMLFKGTKNRTAKQIAAEMDALGGSLNAFTAKENTCYYTRVLGEDVGAAMDILLDMICNPLFSDKDIESEKGVVCEEILMGADDPEDVAHEQLCASIYHGYPMGKPILGTMESVHNIKGSDMINYMNRRYTPENIVIACAGSVDCEEMLRLVNEKYICREHTEKDTEYSGSVFTPGKQVELIKREVEQAHMCMGFPSDRFCGKNAMAVTVINNIFGGATSSRLFQHIREEKGLAYSVYSMNSSYSDTGYFTLYAGTTEANSKDVLLCMLSELDRLKENGITTEELTRCKEQMRRGFLLGLESVSAHSQSLGKDMLWLNRTRDDEELLDELAKITIEDTNEAINILLRGDVKLVVVSKNPSEEMRDIIEKRSLGR